MKQRYGNSHSRLLIRGALCVSLLLSIITSIGSISAQDVTIKKVDDGNTEKYTIVGKVLSNRCRLLSDRSEVVTDYVISITEVREGALLSGNKIKVTIRGGVVLLKADGTEVRQSNPLPGKTKKARVEIPNSATADTRIDVPLNGVASTKFTPFNTAELMENDKTYILTLTKKPDEKTYRLYSHPTLTN